MKPCVRCRDRGAALRRPKNLDEVCKDCFFELIEQEVHATIQATGIFKAGERVAIGASGGKDSTVLAHILTTLNRRHK